MTRLTRLSPARSLRRARLCRSAHLVNAPGASRTRLALSAVSALPAVMEGTVVVAEHQRFTADATAYMRNLDQADLREECFAVHYQDPPRETEGGTTISLRFPLLVVALYVSERQAVAEKVARILEKHWDGEA
jgi:hypothetical protein